MDTSALLDCFRTGGTYVQHAVGSPLDMTLRLSIEGSFVYISWKILQLILRVRWKADPIVHGSLIRRTYHQAGPRHLLANLVVILPLDVIKAVVSFPTGFYLKPRKERSSPA